MKKRVMSGRTMGTISMLAVLSLMASAPAALLTEDFSDSTAAAARFDVSQNPESWLGWFNPAIFSGGAVNMQEWAGGVVGIRTNSANNFVDSGLPVVTYSVTEDLGPSGARVSYLYARLGSSGFGDGYYLYHYFDGTNFPIYLYRNNNGVGTLLYSNSTDSALNNADPTTMSLQLNNNPDSVGYTIRYGAFLATGTDTSSNRITSGVGVGLGFQNNGDGAFDTCAFDNLNVVPEPGILTFLGFGLIGLLRRRG